MIRRVLLVSYHFGEGSDTGGLRWNAMAKHLGEAGWEVDVIASARAGTEGPYDFAPGVHVTPVAVPTWLGEAVRSAAALKRRLLPRSGRLKLNEGVVSALPQQGRDLGRKRGLYTRLMANLDAAARWNSEAGWARRAASLGVALACERPPDVMVVNGPPHPTHLAGVRLSRILRVPLVADFRDPWVFGEWDASESAAVDLCLGRWAQARTFMAAAHLTFNTARSAEAAELAEPRLVGRTTAVPNGYDRREGIGIPDRSIFRVAFVGWLYNFMDPEPVLAACARLRARARLESLRVEFVGTDSAPGGISLLARARGQGLESCFEHRPRVAREEALRIQERAAVQVVFDTPGPLRVPMKFYDCMQMYGDVLLVGQTPSAMGDAAAVVSLPVCAPTDPAAFDAVLDRALQRWRQGAYSAPLDSTGAFAREHASRRMFGILEGLSRPLAGVSGMPRVDER